MAKKTTPSNSRKAAPKEVTALRHADSKRKNIPTAEFQPVLDKDLQSPIRVAYERRNRDLDPQLVWRGKDDQDWSALGEGTNGAVRALAVWDRDGEGPEPPGLYIGGEFTMAGGFPSPYIANWQGCATCYPDCDTQSGPGVCDVFDFLCFGNAFHAGCP